MPLPLRWRSLQHIFAPSTAGKQFLFNRLKHFRSLSYCCLEHVNLDDEDIPAMVDTLGNLSSLNHLCLCENELITSEGWQQFLAILQNPSCRLEILELMRYGMTNRYDNQVDDDVLIALANNLANNTSLKVLQVGLHAYPSVTKKGWEALANVLCNKSSGLRWLNEHDPSWPFDKCERARQKIIDFHFFRGKKNMQTLVSMELALLPRAIAWIGKNRYGRSLLYQLARSLPSLFELAGDAKVGMGGKRKRGLI